MCINTFLLEVAKNFFDADDKLDSASAEGFKDFIKEHDIRASPRSVILYL